MENTHCFTPVAITPPAVGATEYTITYLPTAAVPAATPVLTADTKTFVEYSVTAAGGAGGAGTKVIKFFKFFVGNINPKYINTHNAVYDDANESVLIDAAKTYLVMSKADDNMRAGGSKSARKGRKSARKGRKSARKSRRARGSRSKK